MQTNQHQIHHQRRRQRLKNADDRRLLSRLAQLRQAEFIADGKRDEAQCHVVKQAQCFYIRSRRKAESRHAQLTQAIGTDENARNQVARHSRQLQRLDKAGNQKTGAQRHSNTKKRFHDDYLTFASVFVAYYNDLSPVKTD